MDRYNTTDQAWEYRTRGGRIKETWIGNNKTLTNLQRIRAWHIALSATCTFLHRNNPDQMRSFSSKLPTSNRGANFFTMPLTTTDLNHGAGGTCTKLKNGMTNTNLFLEPLGENSIRYKINQQHDHNEHVLYVLANICLVLPHQPWARGFGWRRCKQIQIHTFNKQMYRRYTYVQSLASKHVSKEIWGPTPHLHICGLVATQKPNTMFGSRLISKLAKRFAW